MMRLLRMFTLSIVALLLLCAPAEALEPADIALVVNTRVPASRKLAEFYAAERHIPNGRIIELNIDPVTVLYPAEEISFDKYEPLIATPIRKFLAEHQLRTQVKCLVTFYGVPFRVAARVLTAAEQSEAAALPKVQQEVADAANQQLAIVEQVAKSYDPTFTPVAGVEPQQVTPRLSAAMKVCLQMLPSEVDSKVQEDNVEKIVSALIRLNGALETVTLLSQPALAILQRNATTPVQLQAVRQKIMSNARQLVAMRAQSLNAEARKQVRQFALDQFGLINTLALTKNQVECLKVNESEAAVDNELAALWWIDYPRARWVGNPLNWRFGVLQAAVGGPTMMVARLDGTSEMGVQNLMERSFQAEQKGLRGIAVVDARGKPPTEPYGQYDQTLRNLAELIKTKTKMPVVLDNEEPVIKYHSIHEPIAVYSGWYNLRSFLPPGDYAPGAVAIHVASYEMISLRGKNEKGWVRGLLSNGVGTTLGAVAEPYLQSFPPADEFFPLMLTGKVTLADAYWHTTPMASWMQCLIGDPLYNPFLRNPQLSLSDLPENLTRGLK